MEISLTSRCYEFVDELKNLFLQLTYGGQTAHGQKLQEFKLDY